MITTEKSKTAERVQFQEPAWSFSEFVILLQGETSYIGIDPTSEQCNSDYDFSQEIAWYYLDPGGFDTFWNHPAFSQGFLTLRCFHLEPFKPAFDGTLLIMRAARSAPVVVRVVNRSDYREPWPH